MADKSVIGRRVYLVPEACVDGLVTLGNLEPDRTGVHFKGSRVVAANLPVYRYLPDQKQRILPLFLCGAVRDEQILSQESAFGAVPVRYFAPPERAVELQKLNVLNGVDLKVLKCTLEDDPARPIDEQFKSCKKAAARKEHSDMLIFAVSERGDGTWLKGVKKFVNLNTSFEDGIATTTVMGVRRYLTCGIPGSEYDGVCVEDEIIAVPRDKMRLTRLGKIVFGYECKMTVTTEKGTTESNFRGTAGDIGMLWDVIRARLAGVPIDGMGVALSITVDNRDAFVVMDALKDLLERAGIKRLKVDVRSQGRE